MKGNADQDWNDAASFKKAGLALSRLGVKTINIGPIPHGDTTPISPIVTANSKSTAQRSAIM
jgi:hypothetical protein